MEFTARGRPSRGRPPVPLIAAPAPPLLPHITSPLLPSLQVLLGAMLDLLTVQCDRHSENIFIDRHGQVQVRLLGPSLVAAQSEGCRGA